jgi:hypothetical protein
MIDDLDDVLHRTHTQGVGGQSGAGRRKKKEDKQIRGYRRGPDEKRDQETMFVINSKAPALALSFLLHLIYLKIGSI